MKFIYEDFLESWNFENRKKVTKQSAIKSFFLIFRNLSVVKPLLQSGPGAIYASLPSLLSRPEMLLTFYQLARKTIFIRMFTNETTFW